MVDLPKCSSTPYFASPILPPSSRIDPPSISCSTHRVCSVYGSVVDVMSSVLCIRYLAWLSVSTQFCIIVLIPTPNSLFNPIWEEDTFSLPISRTARYRNRRAGPKTDILSAFPGTRLSGLALSSQESNQNLPSTSYTVWRDRSCCSLYTGGVR